MHIEGDPEQPNEIVRAGLGYTRQCAIQDVGILRQQRFSYAKCTHRTELSDRCAVPIKKYARLAGLHPVQHQSSTVSLHQRILRKPRREALADYRSPGPRSRVNRGIC